LTRKEVYCPDKKQIASIDKECPICGNLSFKFVGEDWYGCNKCDSYLRIVDKEILEILSGKEFKKKVLAKFRKVEEKKVMKKPPEKAEKPTPEEEPIIEDYKKGLSVVKIKKKYRIGSTKLYKIIKKAGLSRRKEVSLEEIIKMDIPREEKVIKAYKIGAKFKDIKKAFHIGGSTIMRILRKRGIKPRRKVGHRKWSEAEIESLIELKRKGVSYKEIAHILDRSRDSVKGKWNYLEKYKGSRE